MAGREGGSDRRRDGGTDPAALAVVAFWRAAGPPRWFRRDAGFDALVRLRLGRLQAQAAEGALDRWAETPVGALALVLLLDQAPRNLFRESGRAFATDAAARELARAALAAGFERRVPRLLRPFFFLPFMHSESAADQALSRALYRRAGDADSVRWADLHADIIDRFGRFPHRNGVLGRVTTALEDAFLKAGGFAG